MPESENALYLHEEVLLLALRDKKGTIDHRAGQFLNVIAGGILAELLIAGKIELEDSRLINNDFHEEVERRTLALWFKVDDPSDSRTVPVRNPVPSRCDRRPYR